MIALCPLGQNGRDVRHRCAVQGLTTGTEMKKVFPNLVWLIIDTEILIPKSLILVLGFLVNLPIFKNPLFISAQEQVTIQTNK